MVELAPAPIILGNDIGAYAIARSFHEAYGVTSTAVVRLPRGPINDSRILGQELLGEGATDEDLVRRIGLVADLARAAGSEPVLLVSYDSQVELVQRNRAWFEKHMTVLIPPPEVTARVQDKAALPGLAAQVGLLTPREITITVGAGAGAGEVAGAGAGEGAGEGAGTDWRTAAAALNPPFVLKPALSATYESVQFPGLRKVYHARDLAEAEQIVAMNREGGFTGALLLQELIPGDDTHNYVATFYRDSAGVITLRAAMRMVLALHRPTMAGNCAIGLVGAFPAITDPLAELLDAVDYRGFATFDVKVHAHTGQPYLLDINPRIGRSNYFINVGGVNPVTVAWRDTLGERVAPQDASGAGIYRIVPLSLLSHYLPDDAALKAALSAARRAGGVHHPLAYRADWNPKRAFYQAAATFNHMRSFRRDYPHRTESGF